jgi:hypothetical protein
MMRKIDRRLALSLFFVAIFVLCQFIPVTYRTLLLNCSLVDHTQISEQFRNSYGAPLPVVDFLTTTTDCSGNPPTSIFNSFSMEGLLVDILFAVVLGILPYFSFWLVRRFRRLNNAE